MPPIFALLLEMEHKRKLYIGEGDILALSHLITGYCLCARQQGLNCGDDQLRQFDTFVHARLKDNTTHSLYNCIASRTDSQEAAFHLFYRLLHQFLEQ